MPVEITVDVSPPSNATPSASTTSTQHLLEITGYARDVIKKKKKCTLRPGDLATKAFSALVLVREFAEGAPPFQGDDEKQLLLLAVKYCPNRAELFKLASDEARDDADVVGSFVDLAWNCIELASERLRTDRAMLIKTIECCPKRGFARLSDELRADRALALLAVSRHGPNLQHVPAALCDDYEMVHAAISSPQPGSARTIRLASARLRADKRLALIAVGRDGSLVAETRPRNCADKYAISAELRRDREVVLAAVTCPGLKWHDEVATGGGGNTLSWQEIDEAFRRDRELVLAAIDANVTAARFLKHLGRPLNADDELLVQVVVRSQGAFESWLAGLAWDVEWADEGALARILRAAADSWSAKTVVAALVAGPPPASVPEWLSSATSAARVETLVRALTPLIEEDSHGAFAPLGASVRWEALAWHRTLVLAAVRSNPHALGFVGGGPKQLEKGLDAKLHQLAGGAKSTTGGEPLEKVQKQAGELRRRAALWREAVECAVRADPTAVKHVHRPSYELLCDAVRWHLGALAHCKVAVPPMCWMPDCWNLKILGLQKPAALSKVQLDGLVLIAAMHHPDLSALRAAVEGWYKQNGSAALLAVSALAASGAAEASPTLAAAIASGEVLDEQGEVRADVQTVGPALPVGDLGNAAVKVGTLGSLLATLDDADAGGSGGAAFRRDASFMRGLEAEALTLYREAISLHPSAVVAGSSWRLRDVCAVVEAVTNDWRVLPLVPAHMREVVAVGQAACAQHAGALKYCEVSVRSHASVVLAALDARRRAATTDAAGAEGFQNFLPPELWARRDVALAFVRHDGLFLRKVPEKLRADAEIGRAAVEASPEALKYCSKELREDADLCLSAVRRMPKLYHYCGEFLRGMAVSDGPPPALLLHPDETPGLYAKTLELARLATAADPLLLQFCHGVLSDHAELCRDAVSRNWRAYRYCSPARQSDRELLLLACSHADSGVLDSVPASAIATLKSVLPSLTTEVRLKLWKRVRLKLWKRVSREGRNTRGAPSSSYLTVPIRLPTTDDVASILEAGVAQLEALPAADVRYAKLKITYENQPGSDATGLSRTFFSQCGMALPLVGARHGAAAHEPRLFRLTPTEALVPGSAEALVGATADATQTADGTVEPTPPPLPAELLQRYRGCGRLAALSLYNDCVLGLPLAQHFLHLVMGLPPPRDLAELQAAQRIEGGETPSQAQFLATPEFVERNLSQHGLVEMLLPTRAVSDSRLALEVPLAPPTTLDTPITDASKRAYATTWLRHRLVASIAQQADAFRQGVTDVFGEVPWAAAAELLSPSELQVLWGGHSLDDAALLELRARTSIAPSVAAQGELVFSWLGRAPAAKRAQLLKFATGSCRIAHGSDVALKITCIGNPITLQPTAENGLSKPAKLAHAATCFRELKVPTEWQSVDDLAEALEASLSLGEGFGLA